MISLFSKYKIKIVFLLQFRLCSSLVCSLRSLFLRCFFFFVLLVLAVVVIVQSVATTMTTEHLSTRPNIKQHKTISASLHSKLFHSKLSATHRRGVYDHWMLEGGRMCWYKRCKRLLEQAGGGSTSAAAVSCVLQESRLALLCSTLLHWKAAGSSRDNRALSQTPVTHNLSK